MKEIIKEIEGNRLLVEVDNRIYEKDAILNSAYNFSKNCFIHVDPINNDITGVYFESKSDEDNDLDKVAHEFCNDLIDQQIRLTTERDYKTIREEIVKKAFNAISKEK